MWVWVWTECMLDYKLPLGLGTMLIFEHELSPSRLMYLNTCSPAGSADFRGYGFFRKLGLTGKMSSWGGGVGVGVSLKGYSLALDQAGAFCFLTTNMT